MALDLRKLLTDMVQMDASDLHIKSEAVPVYRVTGQLIPAQHPRVLRDEVLAAADRLIPETLKSQFHEKGAVDFAFSIDAVNRFRTNAYHQRGMVSIALRRLAYTDLDFDKLGLPQVMKSVAQYKQGLVLCVGPTGTGKSTTMAALVDHVNSNRKEHIITIEDPSEFVHRDKMSLLDQREIGIDCPSFEEGLRNAMREDPDVILVGEMRDRTTITIGMQAAMTGHLVISTLHTTSAVHTVNRIMQFYRHEEQQIIREDLAGALRAVISQRLIPAADGKNRVPCVEILIVTQFVKKLIRESRIDDVEQTIANGEDGMQSFDRSLADLTRNKKVTQEVAEKFALDVPGFRRMLKGVTAGTDRSAIIGGGF